MMSRALLPGPSLVLACVVAMPVPLPAQRPEPLPIDSVFAMRLIKADVPVRLSPDGRWVALTLEDRRRKHPARPALTATPDSTADPYFQGSAVWVFDATSGDGHQVSPKGATAWENEWSPA